MDVLPGAHSPDKPVVFGFHGRPQRAIHEIVHGHIDAEDFHVPIFQPQMTPTDSGMVVLNVMSYYRLVAEALRHAPAIRSSAAELIGGCNSPIAQAGGNARQLSANPSPSRDFVWTDSSC